MAAREVSAGAVLRQRLAFPLLALIATHVIGVAGYMILWRDQGGTFSDAVFMTFTTVATIGFSEIKPLDDTGRVLTMFVAAGGIGSALYTFTITLDWLASGEIQATRRRRKMKEKIDSLTGHCILVGYGRVGREALEELGESGQRVVVIDLSDENIAAAAEGGWLHIKGDASDDQVLRAAGVARARGLIVTTANDATNLYIVMSARFLAPELHIVSRAVDAHAAPKLERAGANRTVSPYAIGGRRMAHLLLSPRIVDFFETALHRGNKTLSIGEIRVAASSAGIGSTIDELRMRSRGATLLAVVRSPDGAVALATDKLVLASGDHLLALGTDEQLEALESALGA